MSNFPEMEYKPIAQEPIELGPGETSVDLLRRVYRNAQLPLNTRLRAAIEAAPYEHPKLGAVAVTHMTGGEFAKQLDAAIERSNRARIVNAQVIEHRPQGEADGQ